MAAKTCTNDILGNNGTFKKCFTGKLRHSPARAPKNKVGGNSHFRPTQDSWNKFYGTLELSRLIAYQSGILGSVLIPNCDKLLKYFY